VESARRSIEASVSRLAHFLSGVPSADVSAEPERGAPLGDVGLCAAQLAVEAPTLRRFCGAVDVFAIGDF